MTLPREYIICETLSVAQTVRQRYPDLLVDEDDGRTRTVVLSGDALERWIEDAAWIAERERRLRDDRCGQEPLTSGERRRIDFRQTNIPHARSCKAIAISEGVEDWEAYYDTSLSVDEHREIYASVGTRGQTMRRMAHVLR